MPARGRYSGIKKEKKKKITHGEVDTRQEEHTALLQQRNHLPTHLQQYSRTCNSDAHEAIHLPAMYYSSTAMTYTAVVVEVERER